MKRRNFIRSGALALAGFTILPRHILGGTNFVAPSDQINLGIIGCGAQGRWTLAPEFARRANLIAASDCESRQLNAMQAIVEKKPKRQKDRPIKCFKLYADYHELLNRSVSTVCYCHTGSLAAVQTIEPAVPEKMCMWRSPCRTVSRKDVPWPMP